MRDAIIAVIGFGGAAGAIASGSLWGFIFCLLLGVVETREAYLKYQVGNWP